MYPLPDEERRVGTSSDLLMLSSELWDLARYQAPFRRDLVKSSMANVSSRIQKSDRSVEWDGEDNCRSTSGKQDGQQQRRPPECFALTVRGTDHLNFCDMHLMASPLVLKKSNYLGPVDPFVFSEAMSHLILRFFIASVVSRDENVHNSCDALSGPDRLLKYIGLDACDAGATDESLTSILSSTSFMKSSYQFAPLRHPTGENIGTTRTNDEMRISLERIGNLSDSDTTQTCCANTIFKNVEKVPRQARTLIQSALADEESLEHCFDDKYFNIIIQSDFNN